jgi:hypothetical protein
VVQLSVDSAIEIPDLAGLNDEVDIFGRFWSDSRDRQVTWSAKIELGTLFSYVGAYLDQLIWDTNAKEILSTAAFKENRNGYSFAELSTAALDDQLFRTVVLQFKLLGLVDIGFVEKGLAWSITPLGKKITAEKRALRKHAAKQ